MILKIIFIIIQILLFAYLLRHLFFTWARLIGTQKMLYVDVQEQKLPTVSIVVPSHNEELVIQDSIRNLLSLDYPQDLFEIVPLNDRSKDRTKELIDELVIQYPGRIDPFHRDSGKPGKAAALVDVMPRLKGEIIVVFDADYLPEKNLLKAIVTPFVDPKVAAVMGRVIPLNSEKNLLTKFMELERSAGYQVDQQARMNLGLIPQYGGTVGGIRRTALEAVGGWHSDCLSEDTDITFKFFLNGWKVVYQNNCECYEEAPESWAVRIRQIKRWAKGHNQVLFEQFANTFRSHHLNWLQKLDAILLLGIYMMAPLSLLSWFLSFYFFYIGENMFASSGLWLFSIFAFSSVGNFATFFEAAAAVSLDRQFHKIRILPIGFFFFLTSTTSVAFALLEQMFIDWPLKRQLQWDKTARYRQNTGVSK